MDVIVIGASAAGLKAACRIARLKPDAHVTVLTKDTHFGYSSCGLPYYLSGDVSEFEALISTANGTLKDETYFREVKGINVLSRHLVQSIDRPARAVHCIEIDSGRELTLPYDRLVIATGAKPMRPAIPGIDAAYISFFNKPADAINLRRDLERGKISKVTIIGGGFIGLELCEAFRATWGIDVDLIEIQPHVLTGRLDVELARLVEDELVRNGINLYLGCRCREIVIENGHASLLNLAGQTITSDKIILATGMQPESKLARETGLEIGITGGIKVNDHMQTSDPDIYAAGDCVESIGAVDGRPAMWHLGSLASRMGRVVGDNICHGNSTLSPVTGANVLKVFDLQVGSVGLCADECTDHGLHVDNSWGTFYDRMHYYPEAVILHAHLVYDKGTRQVMGVQVVSRGNVLHLIDKASMLLAHRAYLSDFNDIEQCYSPPYSQPFDPLHYLAYTAENSRSSGVKLVSPAKFHSISDKTVVLDVRTKDEAMHGVIPPVDGEIIAIPIEELRTRLHEIPQNRPIVTLCEMGARSWDAAIILRRAGWVDVSILAGGLQFQPNSKLVAVIAGVNSCI